jgi:oligopeptidase B
LRATELVETELCPCGLRARLRVRLQAVGPCGLRARLRVRLQAVKKPHTVLIGYREGENNGENPTMNPPRELEDPYFWLRDDDRKDEEVLGYIKAENQYCEAQTAHLQALRDELYAEMKGHLKETDEEAPYRYGEWMYYTRTEEGKSYTIHCRRGLEPGAAEQVLPGGR